MNFLKMFAKAGGDESKSQPVELGTIKYVNLDASGKHGMLDRALEEARRTGKPIFANFVEWSG